MANRELTGFYLYDGQILYSNKLFEPDTKDLAGKPLDKPSYSAVIRFPKTTANWYDEPMLRPFTEACKLVMARELPNVPYQYIEFPIKDGDKPNKQGKTPDWAKGHWYIRPSTTFPPTVEQRVDGQVLPLPALSLGGRRLWKDGDHVWVAMTMAKRLNDNVGIRCYLNSLLFTHSGEEIKTGGAATDWGENGDAMAQAKAMGIEIKNNPGPGFGGQQQGFPGQGGFPGAGGFNPGAQQQGGFNPGQQGFPGGQQGGFNPGGGGFNPGAQQGGPSGFPGGQQQAPGFNPGAAPGFDKPPF